MRGSFATDEWKQIYIDPAAVTFVRIGKMRVCYCMKTEYIYLHYKYVEDMALDIERITGEKWA